MGESKRRVETLEALLDSSIKKLMVERRDVAINESLREAPAEFHDTIRPVLKKCSTPDDVAENFKHLMALKTGRPVVKEPLPEGKQSGNEIKDPKKKTPVVENTQSMSFGKMLSSKMNRI